MTKRNNLKPAAYAEKQIIDAILSGRYPVNTNLPGEREMASQLGVTRPTLREVYQRLKRDGWLEIHHGKATRVRNFWEEGSLGVLAEIAKHVETQPVNFVRDLLFVRSLIAPAYTRLAIENQAHTLAVFMRPYQDAESTPEVYARLDWQLHRKLASLSGNPIFPLMLNGFADLYGVVGLRYFQNPHAVAASGGFYKALLACAENGDAEKGGVVMAQAMQQSLEIWQAMQKE